MKNGHCLETRRQKRKKKKTPVRKSPEELDAVTRRVSRHTCALHPSAPAARNAFLHASRRGASLAPKRPLTMRVSIGKPLCKLSCTRPIGGAACVPAEEEAEDHTARSRRQAEGRVLEKAGDTDFCSKQTSRENKTENGTKRKRRSRRRTLHGRDTDFGSDL